MHALISVQIKVVWELTYQTEAIARKISAWKRRLIYRKVKGKQG